MKLLYVTWDGPANNYLDGLFFPIFQRLAAWGVQTHVVQFSWDLASFRERTAQAAAQYGVTYEVHAVPRRPLHFATAAAVTFGAALVARAARRQGADVLMPRSHIPAAIALSAHRLAGRPRLVWDSDGLVPDERADFGGWSRTGPVYLGFRALERRMVERSSCVLTRTTHAASLLSERSKVPLERFVVVANGKDPERFSPGSAEQREEVRRELGVSPDGPLLAHVGSLGPQYLGREMLDTFGRIRARLPKAHLLILTAATETAAALCREAGLAPGAVTIRKVDAMQVPRYLRACDGGFAFRQPSLSQRAVCPIKVAEYLLCGVPVLANRGVGDLDAQLAGSEAGLLSDSVERSALEAVANRYVLHAWPHRDRLRESARALGLTHYSIDACAAAYARALDLGDGERGPKAG
ncbi:MAG: glycosyltransferase [Myxococcota bacterium]